MPSRQEAIQRGLNKYQGRPCIHGHCGFRWVSDKACVECRRIRTGRLHPLYQTWLNMRRRCSDATFDSFPYYGERGIKVCERWRRSFANFLLDMGERPGLEYELDRIDNNGDYSPQNCQWATRTIQMRNSSQRKLSIEQVREIRRLRTEGWIYKALAERFDVDQSNIGLIVKGKVWKE